MKRFSFCFFLVVAGATAAGAQQTDYIFSVPQSTDPTAPFARGLHTGARSVSGPFDLDHDSKLEVLLTDYSGGGRVHVIENTGVDSWELVYSTPWLTDTFGRAIRYATGADLDNDGRGEIVFLSEGPPTSGFIVYEHTGTDDDYGSTPASIFLLDNPDRFRAEQFVVQDSDSDGTDEVHLAVNGQDPSYNTWYIFSVSGDIGSGSEVWSIEASATSSSSGTDPVNRGGGSPWWIVPANLNGDSTMDLSLHSWNMYNFTTGAVSGPDSYLFPADVATDLFYQASASDDVALFGGVVVDINNDGDDEIFFSRIDQSESDATSGHLSVLNYELGESALAVNASNLILDVVLDVSDLGTAAGDLTDDLLPDIIGTGEPYHADRLTAGEPPEWIRYATFTGSDPELPANYTVTNVGLSHLIDSTLFDVVLSDSLGIVATTYSDPSEGARFAGRIAYLGDADGDGDAEVAISFQPIADTVNVTNRTWNAGTTSWDETTTRRAVETRPFMRIVSFELTTLPVELTSLIATVDERDVVLSWQTLSETNNSGFAIEHGIERESDGRFVEIAFVDGGGTTASGSDYSWRVAGLESGVHRFRIVQVDGNGNRKILESVEAWIRTEDELQVGGPFPNPIASTGVITLVVARDQQVTATLYNVLGQQVATVFDEFVSADRQVRLAIDTASLAAGSYFVRVRGERMAVAVAVAVLVVE